MAGCSWPIWARAYILHGFRDWENQGLGMAGGTSPSWARSVFWRSRRRRRCSCSSLSPPPPAPPRPPAVLPLRPRSLHSSHVCQQTWLTATRTQRMRTGAITCIKQWKRRGTRTHGVFKNTTCECCTWPPAGIALGKHRLQSHNLRPSSSRASGASMSLNGQKTGMHRALTTSEPSPKPPRLPVMGSSVRTSRDARYSSAAISTCGSLYSSKVHLLK